jgi:hypothetical protein
MLTARRVGGCSKVSPYPIDDRAHTEPSSNQTAFPIIHLIGNAFSHETSIADKVSRDLIPIEPDDPR